MRKASDVLNAQRSRLVLSESFRGGYFRDTVHMMDGAKMIEKIERSKKLVIYIHIYKYKWSWKNVSCQLSLLKCMLVLTI